MLRAEPTWAGKAMPALHYLERVLGCADRPADLRKDQGVVDCGRPHPYRRIRWGARTCGTGGYVAPI